MGCGCNNKTKSTTTLKGKTFVTTEQLQQVKTDITLMDKKLDNHLTNHPTMEGIQENFFTKEEINNMFETFVPPQGGEGEESSNFKKDWGTVAPTDSNKIEVSQIKGTSAQISTYRGIKAQIVNNTDTKTIHLMDGITVGGIPLATQNFVNTNIPEIDMSNIYSKLEINNMLKGIPQALEDINTILARLLGCDHSEEIALLDSINGEVI